MTRLVALMSLVVALSGCATPADPKVSAYVHQAKNGFVRIERIEPGAPDNTHPFDISTAALQAALAGIRVKGTVSMDPVPMFTTEEAAEFSPHLAKALASAGPKEDVTFAVVGHHGVFGKRSPEDMSAGRMFVRAGELNILFGSVHERLDEARSQFGSAPPPSWTPGSRARRVEPGWKTTAEQGRQMDGRSEWLVVDTQSLAAAAAKDASPKGTGTSDRYREIEEKLTVLDRLKANGLITDQEYRERRQKILEGI